MFAIPRILQVLFASIFTSVAAEFLSWLLIFRKQSYKDLEKDLEKYQKQYDSLVEKGINSKKLEQQKEWYNGKMTSVRTDLMKNQMFGMIITGVIMFITNKMIKGRFVGKVVAILPFEPPKLVSRLTHRGIKGNNMREIGHSFIFMLSSFSFKAALRMSLGRINPKGKKSGIMEKARAAAEKYS
ncbi:putative multi-domain containing protein [Aduncisulcus paluster]|uniref:Multi-domain containing protein n=1 Tax=Aduncisulcus paluster TaxID=2918883 RepID=A0ABQ5KBF1_9EUKA|nr:putative multi-domain containing protein [Aduncisulcus paluster]